MDFSILKPYTPIWMVFGYVGQKIAYKVKKIITSEPQLTLLDDGELDYVTVYCANTTPTETDTISSFNPEHFNFVGIKNTKEFRWIFFSEAEADALITSVETGKFVVEKLTPEDRSYGVHMSHCFQGWNRCSCKYGQVDICPANPGIEVLELRENNRIRKHLKPIFVEKYYGDLAPNFSETPDGTLTFTDFDTNNDFNIFVDGYKCYNKFPCEDDDY
jgi:hypothetical protein